MNQMDSQNKLKNNDTDYMMTGDDEVNLDEIILMLIDHGGSFQDRLISNFWFSTLLNCLFRPSQCQCTNTYTPKMYSYTLNTSMTAIKVQHLFLSEKENALYGLTTFNGTQNGVQIFKRDLYFNLIWAVSYNATVDSQGFAITKDEVNLLQITPGTGNTHVIKYQTSNGAISLAKSISGITNCNGIGSTTNYIVASCLFPGGFVNPNIIIINRSNLTLKEVLHFGNEYDYVQIHDTATMTDSVLVTVYLNPLRRNLYEAIGGDVGFQKLKPENTTDFTSMRRLTCTIGCSTSTISRMIETSNEEIFATVTVQSHLVLFMTFNKEFTNTTSIKKANFFIPPQYVYSLVEAQDRQIIYALMDTQDGTMVVSIDIETKESLDFWMTSSTDGLWTIQSKHGLIFYGGFFDSTTALLVKAPFTEIDMFDTAFTLSEPIGYTLEEHDGTEFATDDYSITFTYASLTLGTSTVASLNLAESIVNGATAESKYKFMSPFYSSLKLVGGTTLVEEIQGPCLEDNSVNFTYDATLTNSCGQWASITNFNTLKYTVPVVSAGTTEKFTLEIEMNDGTNHFERVIDLFVSNCEVNN